MKRSVLATLLAVSAIVAILVGAPGRASADDIIYWSNRYGDQIVKTDITTNTTTVLENNVGGHNPPTLGPPGYYGDPDSLIFDTQGNIIYGLTNTHTYPYAQIRSFNPNTNTDSLITPKTGQFSTDLRDLALDPSGTSVLVSDIQNKNVLRVDLSTGNRTTLHHFSSSPGGITYDGSGRLFVNVYDTVYQLDPITGSIIKQSLSAGQFLDGLTYDPWSKKLYAAAASYLIPFDPDTLAIGTPVGNFGGSSNLDGVESDGLGNIIVADIGLHSDGSDGKVWQYNIDLNTTTYLFSAPGVDDIAPIVGLGSPPSSTVPEPNTMLLLGSGLIGLAGYARKRFKK